jgi:hypothetical protein
MEITANTINAGKDAEKFRVKSVAKKVAVSAANKEITKMYLNELLSNTALTENKFATAKKVFDWLIKGKKLPNTEKLPVDEIIKMKKAGASDAEILKTLNIDSSSFRPIFTAIIDKAFERGMSYDEISRMLKISRNTVRQWRTDTGDLTKGNKISQKRIDQIVSMCKQGMTLRQIRLSSHTMWSISPKTIEKIMNKYCG